jgi:hypothetical protein
MTKLVVVLAVVIIVILVIVIIAARSMRAEDPDEFADRGTSRGGRDGRDDGYERHPARNGKGARPPQRQGGGTARMPASAARGFDDRRDQQRSRGYDQRAQDGRGYEPDRGSARGYNERGGPEQRARASARRGDGRPPRRAEESQEPARARPARSRRSSDSSEWDSSEWEKLSDVDYWAELAADKPLTTTAQPAAQARSAPDRDTEALTRRTPAPPAPPAPPRQDPATGLPIRGGRPQPAAADLTVAVGGRADFTPAPVPFSGPGDQTRPVPAALGEPRSSRHADPPGVPGMPALPGPGRAQPGGRPRVDPDDDPLTSPSFPRIPAADSRSYRNGRADTPPRGSSVPAPYPAPAQQFASYGSPAPDFPGNGNGSRDTGPTHPSAYDPLTSRDPYPASASLPPTRPAPPAAPAASGNPYGSYVTPDSQATVSDYREYSGAHSRPAGNDPASYLPPARPGEAAQPSGNGYWSEQPQAPAGIPGPGAPGYLDGRAEYPDPLGAGSQPPDYGNGYSNDNGYANGNGNGYAAHDPAGYPTGSYPAGPHDPPPYPPMDPYGRDGYGGYPGYGPAGR